METETNEETAVAETESALPATNDLLQQGGFGQDIETRDLDRGYVVLLQSNTHTFLDDEECDGQPGEYIRTDTKETIGTKETPLEVIVLDVFKTWRKVKSEEPNQGTSLGSMPFVIGEVPEKEGVTDDGDKYKVQLQYNFICMLPDRLDDLPIIFPLRSTSTGAAKFLITQCNLAVKKGQPSWGKTYLITSSTKQDGNRKWFFSQAKSGQETTPEQMAASEEWFKLSQTVHKPKEASEEVAEAPVESEEADPDFDENDPL